MSSSRNHEQRARGMPYVRKIQLIDGNNQRSRRKPPRPCSDCKDTNDLVKFVSSKVDRIEEIVNDFHENPPRRKVQRFSLYNAKFTVNSVPCELEYDLSNFTIDELQRLVVFTTQNFHPKNNNDKNNKDDQTQSGKLGAPKNSEGRSNIYDLLN